MNLYEHINSLQNWINTFSLSQWDERRRSMTPSIKEAAKYRPYKSAAEIAASNGTTKPEGGEIDNLE